MSLADNKSSATFPEPIQLRLHYTPLRTNHAISFCHMILCFSRMMKNRLRIVTAFIRQTPHPVICFQSPERFTPVLRIPQILPESGKPQYAEFCVSITVFGEFRFIVLKEVENILFIPNLFQRYLPIAFHLPFICHEINQSR